MLSRTQIPTRQMKCRQKRKVITTRDKLPKDDQPGLVHDHEPPVISHRRLINRPFAPLSPKQRRRPRIKVKTNRRRVSANPRNAFRKNGDRIACYHRLLDHLVHDLMGLYPSLLRIVKRLIDARLPYQYLDVSNSRPNLIKDQRNRQQPNNRATKRPSARPPAHQ